MAISATFKADFISFQNAVKTAEVSLKSFEGNAGKVGTSLNKMANSLSGTKMIQDATLMAAAVEKIGGPTKLTEQELGRLGAQAKEAAAKLIAMGEQVPPGIQRITEAAQKAHGGLGALGSIATSAFGQFTLANLASSAIQNVTAKIGAFVSEGMKLPGLERSFKSLTTSAGQSSTDMLASLKRGTEGMVTNINLMQSANKALLLGLPATSESMGELAKTATVLGRAMGQDATKSLDDLITALGRSSPMILDNLGLTVKVGEANEAYAAKLGKSSEALTDSEKKMAFYNAAMEAARKKTAELGEQSKTLSEQLMTAWTSIGNTISKHASEANKDFGRILEDLKNIATQGPRAAAEIARAREASLQEQRRQQNDPNAGFWAQVKKDLQAADADKQALASLRTAAEATRKALAPLTSLQRELAEAFIRGGEGASKIVERLNAVKATAGVTEPQIQKLIDAHQKSKTAAEAHAKALDEIRGALVPLTTAQIFSVLAMDKQSISTSDMAQKLGIAETAIKHYLDLVKEQTKASEEWKKTQEGINKAMTVTPLTSMPGTIFDSKAVGKDLADLAAQQQKYYADIAGFSMTSTQKRLADIERDRVAAVAAIAAKDGATSGSIATTTAAANAYYDHLRDLATGNANTVIERATAAGYISRAELSATAERSRVLYEQMKKHPEVFGRAAIKAAKDAAEANERAARQASIAWAKLKDVFGSSMSGLAGSLESAFSGATSVGGALKGYATNVAKEFTSTALSFIPAIGPILSKFSGPIVEGFKKLFGANESKALIEKSFGSYDALRDKLNSLTGAARETGDALWIQLTQRTGKGDKGATAKLIEQINGLLGENEQRLKDVSAGVGEMVQNYLGASGKITPAMQAMIDMLVKSGKLTAENAREMLGLGETAVPSLNDIQAAAERYGLTLDQLGPKVQQIKIGELSEQIVKDFETLTAAGVDFNTILGPISAAEQAVIDLNRQGFDAAAEGTAEWRTYRDAVAKWNEEVKAGGDTVENMRTQIQHLVTSALAGGLELPATMQPLIDKMVAAGLLVDDFGVTLTDTSKLNFAEPLSKKFDDLIVKLGELVDAILGPKGVAGALDDIGSRQVTAHVKVAYEDQGFSPGEPEPGSRALSFASGTGGQYLDFGSGTLAMLHGRERVMREGESGQPINITVISQLDGREVARNQIRYLPSALTAAGH